MNNEFNEIIKAYFKNFKKITNSSLKKFFLKNNEIRSYVNSLIDDYFKSEFQVVHSIVHDKHLKHCKTCGKLMTYSPVNEL